MDLKFQTNISEKDQIYVRSVVETLLTLGENQNQQSGQVIVTNTSKAEIYMKKIQSVVNLTLFLIHHTEIHVKDEMIFLQKLNQQLFERTISNIPACKKHIESYPFINESIYLQIIQASLDFLEWNSRLCQIQDLQKDNELQNSLLNDYEDEYTKCMEHANQQIMFLLQQILDGNFSLNTEEYIQEEPFEYKELGEEFFFDVHGLLNFYIQNEEALNFFNNIEFRMDNTLNDLSNVVIYFDEIISYLKELNHLRVDHNEVQNIYNFFQNVISQQVDQSLQEIQILVKQSMVRCQNVERPINLQEIKLNRPQIESFIKLINGDNFFPLSISEIELTYSLLSNQHTTNFFRSIKYRYYLSSTINKLYLSLQDIQHIMQKQYSITQKMSHQEQKNIKPEIIMISVFFINTINDKLSLDFPQLHSQTVSKIMLKQKNSKEYHRMYYYIDKNKLQNLFQGLSIEYIKILKQGKFFWSLNLKENQVFIQLDQTPLFIKRLFQQLYENVQFANLSQIQKFKQFRQIIEIIKYLIQQTQTKISQNGYEEEVSYLQYILQEELINYYNKFTYQIQDSLEYNQCEDKCIIPRLLIIFECNQYITTTFSPQMIDYFTGIYEPFEQFEKNERIKNFKKSAYIKYEEYFIKMLLEPKYITPEAIYYKIFNNFSQKYYKQLQNCINLQQLKYKLLFMANNQINMVQKFSVIQYPSRNNPQYIKRNLQQNREFIIYEVVFLFKNFPFFIRCTQNMRRIPNLQQYNSYEKFEIGILENNICQCHQLIQRNKVCLINCSCIRCIKQRKDISNDQSVLAFSNIYRGQNIIQNKQYNRPYQISCKENFF